MKHPPIYIYYKYAMHKIVNVFKRKLKHENGGTSLQYFPLLTSTSWRYLELIIGFIALI